MFEKSLTLIRFMIFIVKVLYFINTNDDKDLNVCAYPKNRLKKSKDIRLFYYFFRAIDRYQSVKILVLVFSASSLFKFL